MGIPFCDLCLLCSRGLAYSYSHYTTSGALGGGSPYYGSISFFKSPFCISWSVRNCYVPVDYKKYPCNMSL